MRIFPTLALAAWPLLGCTASRVAPIPDPLPPGEEWQTAVQQGVFLGLEVRENDSGSLDGLAFDPGVRVTQVVENSPASAAGLRAGDVVLQANGLELLDAESLDAVLAESSPGEMMQLEVLRGDTAWEVSVLPTGRVGQELPVASAQYRLDPQRSRAGWRSTADGVELVSSEASAPFPRAGVPVGSVITAIDGERVLSSRELLDRLQAREAGERIEVAYLDESGEEREARVRLFEPESRVTKASVPILFHYETDVESAGAKFVLLDLWILSLFRYERQGGEREWSFLSLFDFSSGRGELER